MDNIYDLGRKRETIEEESDTEKLLQELNAAFSRDIHDVVQSVEDKIRDRKVVIEGVLGSGVKDFVIASILIYHAAYFLNKLSGHTLNLGSHEMKLKSQEVENLSSVLLTRLLRVERNRFEKGILAQLKQMPLFRRLKKKATENHAEIKRIIKRIEKKDDESTS